MKRTPLKRGTSKLRRTPLRGGKVALRRTHLNRVGKRSKREAGAAKAFSDKSAASYQCEACGYDCPVGLIEAHHVCSRARGVGHPNLHHPGNRAWLCSRCHSLAHEGKLPQYIKTRKYLDTLDPAPQ